MTVEMNLPLIDTQLKPVRKQQRTNSNRQPVSPATRRRQAVSAAISLACVAFDRLQILGAHISSNGGPTACHAALSREHEAVLVDIPSKLSNLAQEIGWAELIHIPSWFLYRSPAERSAMAECIARLANTQGVPNYSHCTVSVEAQALVETAHDAESQRQAVQRAQDALLIYMDHVRQRWWSELHTADRELMGALCVLERVVGLPALLDMRWFTVQNAPGVDLDAQARVMREAVARHVYLRASPFSLMISPEVFVHAEQRYTFESPYQLASVQQRATIAAMTPDDGVMLCEILDGTNF